MLTPEQRTDLVRAGHHAREAKSLLERHKYAMASGEQYPIISALHGITQRIETWLSLEGATAEELQSMEPTK